MADIAIRILAGLCGAALFAIVNQYVLTLTGPMWLAALGGFFLVAFLAALAMQHYLKKEEPRPLISQTRGSDNLSGGSLVINVEGVPMGGATTARDGAGNISGTDMDITIKDKK